MPGDRFCTPAWLLLGITGSVPGVLELADQRLVLTSVQGQVFSIPLAAIEQVIFPWYYFGGGAKFRMNDRVYRVSFVKPNGADDIPARLLAMTGVGLGAGLATVVQKMVDVRDGRRAGKAWRAVLEALRGDLRFPERGRLFHAGPFWRSLSAKVEKKTMQKHLT